MIWSEFRAAMIAAVIVGLQVAAVAQRAGRAAVNGVPENTYRGELVSFPGPWSFQLGKSAIILVSDKELEALSDPDHVLNLALGFNKDERSLRQVCEQAKAAGNRTLVLAFDHFFSQYRPGQEGPRHYTPDMDEYVKRIAAISKFADGYGLGLELSLLSPLEIGPAYEKQTGESGVWMQYRKGLRDPQTGAFSVSLWQQKRWANNKGVIELPDAGVRVFAFHENAVPGTLYRVVDPNAIVEISDQVKVESYTRDAPDSAMQRIRVYGSGHTELAGFNRVLVVQQYRTPEMDYFSPRALPYLNKLVDKYADAGVKLNALYSDEMHIQQDWNYFGHHDNGEFNQRYVTPGLSRAYARKYGAQYSDLAKYLVYFCYGQEDTGRDVGAKLGVSHVFGATPEAIRQTALFRSRYFRLLQDGVVDLFTAAKKHAEDRMGHKLESRAHATWAESPTIDKWETGESHMYASAYEYTSNFVWSDTVHQASAACYDYFKWGDFLTGNGNDHCECGWLDRNYVGLMMACSTGIINQIPYSYSAHWGMPDELSRRRMSLVNTYGAAGSPLYGMVQNMEHRDVSVLMLYPLDLVAVEERFGSWMTQYGYANYITSAKLLELGQVHNGAIELGGRHFTTLVATFEPFPSHRLLKLAREFVEGGGKLIWSGPPPVLSEEGDSILKDWCDLFGVDYAPARNEGQMAPGKQVTFSGKLAGLPPQIILTDFIVDHVYSISPRPGTEILAKVADSVVGSICKNSGRGEAIVLGFRPRDDQSKSLGYESRWWFDILHRTGAYGDAADNTELLSRTTDFLTCRFSNGAVAVTRHLRETEEAWNGGFARNKAEDTAYLKRVPPPSEQLKLDGFHVNGHTVSYTGDQAMTFKVDIRGNLAAFSGSNCRSITVDGRQTTFADKEIPQIAWAPVDPSRHVPGGAVLQIMVYGTGTIRIPAMGLPPNVTIFAEGVKPGSKGKELANQITGGSLVVTVTPEASGRWLYVTPAK